jgi:hypothetical protein
MTTATIKVCDVCKAEGRSDTEREKYNLFEDIKIEFELHAPYSSRRPSKYYTLCEQCLAKIGVFKKVTNEEKAEQDLSIQNRLYNIVAEIVADVSR